MSAAQVQALRRQVLAFFEDHRHERVPLSKARRWFGRRADLTRPIEHTLQVHGVLERPGASWVRWAYPMKPDAWRLAGETLVPAREHRRNPAAPLRLRVGDLQDYAHEFSAADERSFRDGYARAWQHRRMWEAEHGVAPWNWMFLHVFEHGRWWLVRPGLEDQAPARDPFAAAAELGAYWSDAQSTSENARWMHDVSVEKRRELMRVVKTEGNPSLKREMEALVREAVELGCRVKEGRHWKLLCPGGTMVVTSKTPSDWRGVANFRAQLRRAGVQVGRRQNPAKVWFHGDPQLRTDFRDQRWDRDRTTSSLNEDGPGVYFTTNYDHAASYGAYVVELRLPKEFRALRRQKPTMKALRKVFGEARPEQQERFLADWDGAPASEILAKYARQPTLHGALVSLYGDLFQYDADAWIAAVRELGYDGVIVPKSYGVEHLIVWAPEKILGYVHEASPPEDNPRSDVLAW